MKNYLKTERNGVQAQASYALLPVPSWRPPVTLRFFRFVSADNRPVVDLTAPSPLSGFFHAIHNLLESSITDRVEQLSLGVWGRLALGHLPTAQPTGAWTLL